MLEQNNAPAPVSARPGTVGKLPFRSSTISSAVAKRFSPGPSFFLLRKSIVWSSLILFTLALCQSHVGGAPDPNLFESQNVPPQVDPILQESYQSIAREQQELYRTRVPIADAMNDDVSDATAPRTANQSDAATQTPPSAEAAEEKDTSTILIVASVLTVMLVGTLVARRFAPGLFIRLDPFAPSTASGKAFAAKVRAEEESFTEFIAAFHSGPGASAPDSENDQAANMDPAASAKNSLKEFSNRVAAQMATQRRLILDINRAMDDAIRKKLLADLRCEITALKAAAGLPALRTVWQITSAMEGLLRQLTDKPANILPSTLRTVAGGVDLLNELCAADLKPDLLATRPLKLLAVDDDLVSRKALSLALKKALNEPDLAANSEAALALAAEQTYDVIFLDVQMPGMDGFELCSMIHETARNRTTPIVFVTSQSDFDARAQSTLSGGHDLMGKPFLTFEVTVKALTLGLRRRLKGDVVVITDTDPSNAPAEVPSTLHIRGLASDEQPSTEPVAESVHPSESHTATENPGEPGKGAWEMPQSRLRFSAPRPEPEPPIASFDSSPEELADLLCSRAATHLAPMRELLDALFQTADEEERQEMLADIYLRIHAFAPKENITAAHPVMRLSSALEGLLRKLLENTNHSTTSTLVTLVSGVDLLNDLCALRMTSDLDDPPIQLLVVDDDLVARRAIACALQMTFGRPEAAENGEAALALAMKKRFDVIFLDVQMPGMNGLTVCSKIRETALNAATPVVFVTAQDDADARTQMSQSGGNDFIGRPFLNSEISVKALAFALRTRLQKLSTPAPVASDTPVELVT